MSADDNVKTIQTIYEAFGRGDVAAIQEACTDDVDWASEAATGGAPWYGSHTGKDGVMSFFQAFGSSVEVSEFTPLTFATDDAGNVLTVVRYGGQWRATGKAVAMDLHHYWKFRDGLVCYYRGTEDTAQTLAAMQA